MYSINCIIASNGAKITRVTNGRKLSEKSYSIDIEFPIAFECTHLKLRRAKS